MTNYKLIKHNQDEGTLIVEFNIDHRINSYYANVISFNQIAKISEQINIGTEKYFYRNNLLIIKDLTDLNVEAVIKELEETGDLFDVMESLTQQKKILQRIKALVIKIKKWLKFTK